MCVYISPLKKYIIFHNVLTPLIFCHVIWMMVYTFTLTSLYLLIFLSTVNYSYVKFSDPPFFFIVN